MGQSLTSIWDVIRTEAGRGKLIDVDAYCRFFAPLFPHLPEDQIRAEINVAICSLASVPPWCPDEDGDDPSVALSR